MTDKKAEPKGYKDHKPGSRKGLIHELFDREGADTAWTRGLKMKLAEATLRSWFGTWNRDAKAKKPKPVTKPAKKPAKKVSKPTIDGAANEPKVEGASADAAVVQ